ncbi:hypothetical protein H5410_013856 [Solanum commersonii]|nr:hypothetical protein H5410_013856 [Solanum commersonii]
MQVMASRDLPIEFAAMKGKLLRLGDISNCGIPCKSRSDCKEVNLSWAPNKMQVMALRDLSVDVEEMKGKLLRLDDITTCGRRCKVHGDCKEGVICSTCLILGSTIFHCV